MDTHDHEHQTVFQSLDPITLFWFIVTFVLIVKFFMQFDIKLSFLVGLLVACIFIYIVYNDYLNIRRRDEHRHKFKRSSIIPNPKFITDVMEELLYELQELYMLNPAEYENMVKYVDQFFIVYNQINTYPRKVHTLMPILLEQKRNALNSFSRLIFGASQEHNEKIKIGLAKLEAVLDKYINFIVEIYKDELYENGYHTGVYLYDNSGVKPYNIYLDETGAINGHELY